MVPSPAVEDKKVLGEIAQGPVEPCFGVVSGVRSCPPASLPWDPWEPAPPAAWAEGLASRRSGEGASWLGWEPGSQSPGIRSPTVISFFPSGLFPTRKGLMLRIHIAHPSQKACLRLAKGALGRHDRPRGWHHPSAGSFPPSPDAQPPSARGA